MPIKINKNVVQQPTNNPAILAPPKTVKETATGMILKAKDLAISDLQVQQDISTGLYTISCKITNAGGSNILLDPIRYFKCNHDNYTTAMNWLIVQCKIEPEDCRLSGCGYVPSYMLLVNKPNGTPFAFDTYSTEEERTLKPGQSFIAKTRQPVSIFWGKPSPCSSEKIEVMLVLDPINQIGDEDLSNNTLKAYFPIQN